MRFFTYISLFAAFLAPFSAFSQLSDDFSDGDFSANPAWVGDAALFQINATGQLQSNGNAATDTIYLATPNAQMLDKEWRFDWKYTFAPSSQNFARMYLVSNQANLAGNLNGYFLQIGETGSSDVLRLYRQDGATNVLLASGTTNLGTNPDIQVKVTLNNAGDWNIFTAPVGTGAYNFEAFVNDATYSTTTHFGVYIVHTSTNKNKHFFDNFYIGNTVVDNIPPTVNNATVISQTELDVLFSEAVEQTSAETASNYLANNGLGAPVLAQQDAGNPALIHLVFSNNFASGVSNLLTVTNVKDLNNNIIGTNNTANFTYTVPVTATYKDIIITEIFADPTPIIGLPDAEYLELYNRTTTAIDLNGWKLRDGATLRLLPSFTLNPNSYVVVTSSANASLFTSFGAVIATSTAISLTNASDQLALLSPQNTLIDTVAYTDAWYQDANKKLGGWSLELINPNTPCSGANNWIASNASIGGTPATQNSVYNTTADQTPPVITNTSLIALDSILVCFDGSLDAGTVNISDFQLNNGIGQPLNVIAQSADNQCFILALATPLTEGVLYILSVQNLSDCSGNALTTTLTANVVKGIAPQPFEVIITEMMIDENPPQSLPLYEFVEIYNRTNKVLDISGWRMIDASGSGSNWGNQTLLPNQYAIICDDAAASAFAAYGKVIPVATLPSLNADTDSMYLQDAFETNFDYVFYADTWYQDDNKKNGGWTLERKDLNFINCNNAGNWEASVNLNGGTPAAQNSINGTFIDNNSPTIATIEVVDNLTVKLKFSEAMDVTTLVNTANYSISPSLGTLQSALPDLANQSVTLSYTGLISNQIIYTLTVNNLKDCAGNSMTAQISFGLPVNAQNGDVILNEFLTNPYTDGADFVELYNVSDKILDLSKIYLGEVYPNTDSVYNVVAASDVPAIWLPHQLLCLTTDIATQVSTYNPDATAQFFQVKALPSYEDTEGEIIIFTENNVVLDRIKYTNDNFRYPLLKEGVSWERIDSLTATQQASNWQTAAFEAHYATPGYANSKKGKVQKATSADVLLNEILFNPKTGGADYVEIYNNSTKTLDLSSLRIGKSEADNPNAVTYYKVFGEKDYLAPKELLCLTTNVQFQLDTYSPPSTANLLELDAFPTFEDTEGLCWIMNNDSTLMDKFLYKDDYHFKALADKNGVALERISLTVSAENAQNWYSAASTVNYGTPGYANSQQDTPDTEDSEVWLNENVFTPDGNGDKDKLLIHYKFGFNGANARVNIFDPSGRLVRTLQNNQLLGTEPGFFVWNGLGDNGNLQYAGAYVILFEVMNQDTGAKKRYRKVAVLAEE
ncbi:MAG: lamin tail domain-containing protein [Bacteroidia bacterium]